MDIVIACTRKV